MQEKRWSIALAAALFTFACGGTPAPPQGLVRQRLRLGHVTPDRPGVCPWRVVGAPTGPRDDPRAQLAGLSYRLWPAFADDLRQECGLDPELRLPGCLSLAFDEAQAEALQRAFRSGGIPGGAVLEGAALREAEPRLGPRVLGALRRDGGNVENRRLCRALELAARRRGVELRSGAEVRAISIEGGRLRGVEPADGLLPAGRVLVAAGAWSGGLPGCQAQPGQLAQKICSASSP